jgi:transposase
MRRFVEQADRGQSTLLPECLDDFIGESNPVRVIDVFVDALDLAEMSFEGVEPAATGRPSYHPSVLLKLYIYGYLNRVQSSRRLEREAGRNVEVMWLRRRASGISTGSVRVSKIEISSMPTPEKVHEIGSRQQQTPAENLHC